MWKSSDPTISTTRRGTRSLRALRYTVNGTPYVVDDPSLVGNKLEMERAYVDRLDNLDTSYYTFSYYGVDGEGNLVLESVAVRRLNDTDPDVNALVAGKYALHDGVYLTEDNWSSYLDALNLAPAVRQTIDAAFTSSGFSDQTVETLITTAFGQTLRDDVTTPIMDGLLINLAAGNVDSIDIQSLEDDAGFYLPKVVTVNRSTEHTVTVDAEYVLGRQVGTQYTVAYDIVSGLSRHGLWLSSFETLDLKLDGREGDSAEDTINVQSTHHLATLTVNTGDGDDSVNLQTVAAEAVINAGPGADTVTVQAVQQQLAVTGGDGDDTIVVNYFMDGAAFTVNGETGRDDIYVRLAGNGSASIDVFDSGDSDSDTDSLWVDGSDRANPLTGCMIDGAAARAACLRFTTRPPVRRSRSRGLRTLKR